ncbi:MAG: hypothetical protein AAF552_04590 [Pseudomonadota bacterium]
MAKSAKYRRKRGLLGSIFFWLRNAVLVAAVAVIGAKFYADYRLNRSLEQLAGMVAPVGTLTVADNAAGFDGTLSADNISFIPDPGVDLPPITMRRAELQTPGLLWVLGLGRSELPNSMGLNLGGMRVELGDLLGQEQRSSISGLTTETLACGDVTRFETIDLNNMGFDSMESTVEARYRLLPPDVIDVQMVIQNANAAEIHMELKLAVENLNEVRRSQAPPAAGLKSLGVTLQASEFNRRRNSYCAAQSDISSDEFLDNHMAAVAEETAGMGFKLSDELTYQYRRFAAGEGVWTFLSRPDRPLAMEEIAALGPDKLLEGLNVNSAVASGVPQRVSIISLAPEPAMVLDDSGVPGAVAVTGGSAARAWKLVETGSLASYTGRNVRLNSKFGKEYTGVLVSVSDGKAVIDTLLPGGSAQIPIPLDQIFRARVLTRG